MVNEHPGVISAGPRGSRLINHELRGRKRYSPWLSWLLILFGAPFILAGGIGIWGWFGVRPTGNTPTWLVKYVGCLFFLPGVLIASSSVYAFFVGLARQSREEQFADQPWLYDYEWDATEVSDRAGMTICRRSLQIIGVAAMLALFNGMAWGSRETVAWVLVGFFDLIFLTFIFAFVYRLIRFIKYGSSRLTFQRFPFFLGEKMELHWVTGRPIGAFSRLNMILRCVEERTVTVRSSGGKSETYVHCYEIHAIHQPIEQAGVQETVTALSLSFDLPDEPLGRPRPAEC